MSPHPSALQPQDDVSMYVDCVQTCLAASDSIRPRGRIACQAPLSMGFSRQEFWSGLPFPSSGDLPSAGIEPGSPAPQAVSLLSEPPGEAPGGSRVPGESLLVTGRTRGSNENQSRKL